MDPLQVNSRFAVYYPEKRPFFLEGMDLLGVQGAQRQFYSRAILAPLYGLKASGTNDWASWTVLVAKDRVLGNNPVAALYTRHSYYQRLAAPRLTTG